MNVGELLRETVELYRRNARTVLVSTVPIILIVTLLTALGLGELSAKYNPGPPARDLYIDVLASELVTVPLISSILARWVYLRRRGEQATIADLVAGALEVFPAVLLVVVAWFAVAVIGLVTLVIPGIYVAVSWYFVVQAVVIDGDRGFAPIARSAATVRGRWWQSLGTGVAVWLAAFIPQLVLAYAFTPVARSANSYAVVVVAVALARVIAFPFVAIASTLYYLQLRDTPVPVRRF